MIKWNHHVIILTWKTLDVETFPTMEEAKTKYDEKF
jgi:hypothetical protein